MQPEKPRPFNPPFVIDSPHGYGQTDLMRFLDKFFA